jgi:hypothetical protein
MATYYITGQSMTLSKLDLISTNQNHYKRSGARPTQLPKFIVECLLWRTHSLASRCSRAFLRPPARWIQQPSCSNLTLQYFTIQDIKLSRGLES